MLLTIAVCTYNRAELLRECLQSLTQQSVESDNFKILVVDNNSSDDTRTVCDTMGRHFKNFEYLFEPKQGLSAARNAAWNHTATPWIAFFDDDALASCQWVETILETIDEYNFDCFGGPFYPWYRDGKARWFLDEYASNHELFKYQQATTLEKEHIAGCNMVFRRAVFDKIGGFSEEIGMAGHMVAYGEETQLQNRLRNAGMTVGYIPKLQIKHYIQPSRQTFRWQLKRAWAEGRDSWDAELEPRTFYNLLKYLIKAPLGIVKSLAITFVAMLKGHAGPSNLLLNASTKSLYYISRALHWYKR